MQERKSKKWLINRSGARIFLPALTAKTKYRKASALLLSVEEMNVWIIENDLELISAKLTT